MVFDISWEPGQDALILFFFYFFLNFHHFLRLAPHTLLGLSGSSAYACPASTLWVGVSSLGTGTYAVPSYRNFPDVSHFGQSELSIISMKLEKKAA